MTNTIIYILFFHKKTMKNKLTVIFPSRPNINNIKWLLWCLESQTFQDFSVIVLLDSVLTLEKFSEIEKVALDWLKKISQKVQFISNINSDFVPQKWVSYVRNYGIKLADTQFINLFDDDEVFDPDYLQKTFDLYNELKLWAPLWKGLSSISETGDSSLLKTMVSQWNFILVPKLMYRKTWKIQSEWFDYYNFWTTRPHQFHFNWEKFAEIQMFSGNSLFWPTKIFQKILFDERFDFVYEDLEFTYRLHKSGYPIFIASELEIYHMERDKTPLENAWIGSEFQAYRKAKHRIWFVKKHANKFQKIQFYLFGYLGCLLRFILKILILAPKKDRKTLISAIIRGTRDWMNK